jgi:hypothetical protein
VQAGSNSESWRSAEEEFPGIENWQVGGARQVASEAGIDLHFGGTSFRLLVVSRSSGVKIRARSKPRQANNGGLSSSSG